VFFFFFSLNWREFKRPKNSSNGKSLFGDTVTGNYGVSKRGEKVGVQL